MPKQKPASVCRMPFRRMGGSNQLVISSFDDFRHVLELDEAFWAVTSVNVEALRLNDPRFTDFLDFDHNRTIRSDEVRKAVAFMLNTLRDGSGVNTASSTLALTAINTETPDGDAAYRAARQILDNLGKSGAETISLDEVGSNWEIIRCAGSNGDGVVIPEPDKDPELAALISLIIATTGGTPDLSGVTGTGVAEIAKFEEEAERFLAWYDTPSRDPEHCLPFGDRTAAFYAVCRELVPALDAFFLSCEALAFLDSDRERIAAKTFVTDVLAPEAVQETLAHLSIAAPRRDGILDFQAPLNPVWRDRLSAFAAFPESAAYTESGHRLSGEQWKRLKEDFSGYAKWLESKPGNCFDSVDPAKLRKTLNSLEMAGLKERSRADLAAAEKLSGGETLLKLLLFQKYLLEFLNNFVNLSAMFSPTRPSMLQSGSLVMAGRRYTLVTPVANVAEHKRIATMSDICVIYIEITGGTGSNAIKKNLAVAVTSGSMRDLFVGKHGVFFAASGEVCDARVIDFVEQPVSISEALKSPFFHFGNFVGKQADRFFTTKSTEVQKNLGGEITAGLSNVATPMPAKPAAQTPAVSGSMMLMGGGIGLAAIGSSVAFIAKSLQNISILNVLAVLLGIIVIFGGPLVVISLVKLFRRDLSRFLEAEGCAVNLRMRLSHRMGKIFSFRPQFPAARFNGLDLVDAFSGKKPHGKMLIWLIIILIAAVTAGGIFWIRIGCHQREMLPATPIRPAQSASTEPAATPAAMAPAPQDSISGAKK